jgi:hypothetical protein
MKPLSMKSWVGGCLAGVVWMSISGCGMLHRAKQEGPAVNEAADLTHAAESLNLRIVRAGEGDAHLPDPSVDLKSERVFDKIVVSTDELAFKDNIYLRESESESKGEPIRELFLVWDEHWLGSVIQSAFVDHRLEDDKSNLSGAPERKAAMYDEATHRWFISVSALLKAYPDGQEPAWQHLLNLDLSLADGSRRLIHVRFRAIGLLSATALKLRNETALVSRPPQFDALNPMNPDLSQEVHAFGTGGIAVGRTWVKNPTHQKLKLWLQARPGDPLALHVSLGQLRHGQGSDVLENGAWRLFRNPPSEMPMEWQRSAGEFELARAEIHRGNAPGPEVLTLDSKQPRTMLLAPGEEVAVDWVVAASKRQSTCPFPNGGTGHYEWTTGRLVPGNHGAGPGIFSMSYEMKSADLPEPWKIGGYFLSGSWNASLSVSSPREDHPGEGEIHLGEKISQSVGVHVPESREFSCQGLF